MLHFQDLLHSLTNYMLSEYDMTLTIKLVEKMTMHIQQPRNNNTFNHITASQTEKSHEQK